MAALLRPGMGGALGGLIAGLRQGLIALGAATAVHPRMGARGGPGPEVKAPPTLAPLIASVVPALLAWLIWFDPPKVLASPGEAFVGLAAGLGVLSMVGPGALVGTTGLTRALQAWMHIPAAAGAIWRLPRGATSSPSGASPALY